MVEVVRIFFPLKTHLLRRFRVEIQKNIFKYGNLLGNSIFH